MKLRIVMLVVIVIALSLIVWAAFHATAATEPSMARLMPQGAVVFLEAKDFSALLRDWTASPEKQVWLKSANYETFSRSRLLLRLQQVQQEFASAAGIPPNFNFLNEVAGERSALALYDIGKLELLYIARVPSARAMQSALWQQRSQFEPRQVAGRQFFVRTEPKSGRVVAFAIQDDYLVLGTREDLVAGAVTLLAGQKLATLADESWFARLIKAGKEPGDLRMALHLSEVTKTPQFRTYWIQRNVTAMRQYESALSDLYRSAAEYREERVLIPTATPDNSANSSDDARRASDLLRLAPPDIGFYRAIATSSVDDALVLVEEKILTPRLGPAPPTKAAPAVSLGGGAVGSQADLETRIDVPPTTGTGEAKPDEQLKALLTSANPRAALELHRSQTAPDGVFTRLLSTVVLSSATDWNEQSARAAVQRIVAPALTTSQLGVAWKQVGAGAQAYAELDGLAPIVLAIRGKYLVLSNDPPMVATVLGRMREPASAEPVFYAAAFNHAAERQNYYRFAALIDRPSAGGNEGDESEPPFFSKNVASLSQVFGDVKSQTVLVRRNAGLETQTVRYVWAR